MEKIRKEVSSMPVSVVIPVYNTAKYLRRRVDSILSLSRLPPLESGLYFLDEIKRALYYREVGNRLVDKIL